MTADPATPAESPDDIVQMNVRVRRGLRDAVDARRAEINGGISRDKWVAAEWQAPAGWAAVGDHFERTPDGNESATMTFTRKPVLD